MYSMKDAVYTPPRVAEFSLQVENTLCASVEKSFDTNDFATISETDITRDWQL